MEVLNISLDDNEGDTSHDELDEDPQFDSRTILPSTSQASRFINREVISSIRQFSKLFQDWERPPLEDRTLFYSSSPPWEAQPEPFQFLFLDSVSSVSRVKHRSIKLDRGHGLVDNANARGLHTVIRLFGVARAPSVYSASEELFGEDGDDQPSNSFSDKHTFSVCCNVHGFLPYFYALPTVEYDLGSRDFLELRGHLEDKLNEDVAQAVLNDLTLVEVHDFLSGEGDDGAVQDLVRIEGMRLGEVENSIFLFPSSHGRSKAWAVLKVYVALPMFVPTAARLLDNMKVESVAGAQAKPCEFQTFESNLTNNIRFLTDRNLPGCTWLELKRGKYFRRADDDNNEDLDPDPSSFGGGLRKESHCQIELDVHFNDISISTSTSPENEPDQNKEGIIPIPPLRILSFDLESRVAPADESTGSSQSNQREQTQVIQIGAVLSSYGGASGDPIIGKAAFVLGTCEPLKDAKVIQVYDKDNPSNNSEANLMECEALLLASFRDFLVQMDPDIITGYNVKNFDLPYLLERAEKYEHQFEEVKRFPFLGRLKQIKTSIRPILNENKKLYRFDKQLVNIQGRIIMDMYPMYIRHETGGKKSLKLKHVSERHLNAGEEKGNVDYTEINGLQDGDPKTRKRLAKYCVQDSYLPVKLMLIHMPDRKSNEMNFLEYYFELSQLSGTILRYLVNKSKDYNKYFKQVRVQKNNGRVKYYPDSPLKKSPASKNGSAVKDKPETIMPETSGKSSSRILFADN